jgi:hypothetical protein
VQSGKYALMAENQFLAALQDHPNDLRTLYYFAGVWGMLGGSLRVGVV